MPCPYKIPHQYDSTGIKPYTTYMKTVGATGPVALTLWKAPDSTLYIWSCSNADVYYPS